jgi:hypothetical protein
MPQFNMSRDPGREQSVEEPTLPQYGTKLSGRCEAVLKYKQSRNEQRQCRCTAKRKVKKLDLEVLFRGGGRSHAVGANRCARRSVDAAGGMQPAF